MKQQLRAAAREKRKTLARADFAGEIARYADALPTGEGAVIGAYHALPEEADPALLLEALAARGRHIAFPRIVAKGLPLEYHRIPDGEMMSPGAFGIHEPLDHWPRVRPDLLLVPLLAFDGRGHRLGYGGGFYDRTLALLNIPAIGIAYAGQEVASLPDEPHDRTLDMILTEQGIRKFR
ncbi:MAG TPA: 5-formyltetrahydrofolate cyclo-ligase [Rhizomicrobium sp.]|nr:5-formyltetrahydrofolate cyclo-ligase [Rhizomicrobium sp.]